MAEVVDSLCTKHGLPILQAQWNNGSRKTGCRDCKRFYVASPEAREKRKARWNSEFIACINHPYKRCREYMYAYGGKKLCSWCSLHRADGTLRPSYIRAKKKQRKNPTYRENKIWYQRSQRRANRIQAIKF